MDKNMCVRQAGREGVSDGSNHIHQHNIHEQDKHKQNNVPRKRNAWQLGGAPPGGGGRLLRRTHVSDQQWQRTAQSQSAENAAQGAAQQNSLSSRYLSMKRTKKGEAEVQQQQQHRNRPHGQEGGVWAGEAVYGQVGQCMGRWGDVWAGGVVYGQVGWCMGRWGSVWAGWVVYGQVG